MGTTFKKMTGLEIEGFDYQSEAEDESAPSEIDYVSYSVKIIDVLTSKMKAYNKEHSNRANLKQLREVYREAGLSKPCAKWCLAKVNMYLRMKAGQNVYKCKPEEQKNELTGLELEERAISTSNTFNVADSLHPSEEDFKRAEKDIEDNKLISDFKNIDNLYLDEYKDVNIDWS